MRKVMLLLCLMIIFSWPSAAEPIPPGPICPDPCTEYHCTPQGICYCRPYPWPERCGPLTVPLLFSALSANEAPDANACLAQCKAECSDTAALVYFDCVVNQYMGIDCAWLAAESLRACKWECEHLGNTCNNPI